MKLLMSSAFCSMILLMGCQTTTQAIVGKENLLSAAGFSAKPAATASQLVALESLPANQLVQQNHNGQMVYLYADPVVCQCVYAGGAAAYSKYRQMIFQQDLIDEQEMNESIIQSDDFDFGPWGGFWGY